MSALAYDRLVPSPGVLYFDRLIDTTGSPAITSVGTPQEGVAIAIVGTSFSATGNSVFIQQGSNLTQIAVASESTTLITTVPLDVSGLYLTRPISIQVVNNSAVASLFVASSILPATGTSSWAITQEFLGDASTRLSGQPELSVGDEIRIASVIGGTISDESTTGQGASVVTAAVTAFMYSIFDGTILGSSALAQWANPVTTATVPDVGGLTQAAANSAILAVGLVPALTAQVPSATLAAGLVAGQFPAAGQMLTLGGTVELTLSLGSNVVLVPNMTGQLEAFAEQLRVAAGLIGFTFRLIDGVNSGLILNQSVAPGTPVAIGSEVDLVVSSNRCPDFIGYILQDAEALINSSNLSFDPSTFLSNYDMTYPQQVVIGQSPEPDAIVAPGANVILTLSLGFPPQRQGVVNAGMKRRTVRRMRLD